MVKIQKGIIIFYYLLIICPIFQDFFLGKFIGKIGDTPIPIILFLSTIYILIYRIRGKFYKENKPLFILLIYLVYINIFMLFIHIFVLNGQVVILGENILIKSLKSIMYFLFINIYVFNINTYMENLDIKKIFRPFIIATNILLFAHIFEIYSPSLFNQLFHNGTVYNRIRLFTSESSFTAIMIFIYPIISIYYYLYKEKSKHKSFFYTMIFIFFIVKTGSKSIIINIPIAIIILILSLVIKKVIQRKIEINVLKVMLSIVLGGIIIIIALPKIHQLFGYLETDMKEYTSIITRYYTVFIAFIISLKYPFGIGNALYLYIFPKNLQKYIYLISDRGYKLNEIYSYINATDDSMVTSKSGISQYAMYWGIIGTIIFIIYFIKIYLNILRSNIEGKNIIMLLFLIIFIGIINFASFDINYEIFAFLLLSQYLYKYNKITS